MFISIRNLAAAEHDEHFERSLDSDMVVAQQPDIVECGPLNVRFQAHYAAGAVEVGGRLAAEMTLVCSRCLTHFEHALEVPVKALFKVKDRESEAEDDALDADDEADEDTYFVTGSKVDLRPFFVENVLLNVPFIPICDPDCKGLCPVCGVNRNEQSCGCKPERIDPRLAGLKGFFEK